MKAGILGLVHGEFGPLEDTIETVDQEGAELKRCIEIESTVTLDSGQEIQIGNAAKEEYVKEDTTEIRNGSIRTETERRIETDKTNFIVVPGELVVVGSAKGTFAFDLIGRQVGALIERAEINLEAFVEERESASFWQYGFYNTGMNAENGVVYGNAIEDVGTVQDFMSSATPNQIGFDYLYGDKPVKAKMAESGYVEVYQPSDWESTEFIQFVLEEISPYIRSP